MDSDQIESNANNHDCIRHVFIMCSHKSTNLPLIETLLPKITHLEEKKTNDSKPNVNDFPATSIHYQHNPNPNNDSGNSHHLINLLYSPEPIHFASELVSNLTIADGVLLVVDCFEGFSTSLDTLLHYTLAERVKPVLVIDNIYRYITEFGQDAEMVYQNILRIVESVNLNIATSAQPFGQDDISLSPARGNIAFECGKGCFWSFTIPKFASLYSKKFNIDIAKLSTKLWGDHFYDPDSKTWTTHKVNKAGNILNRGFVEFILKPIIKIIQRVMTGQEDKIIKMVSIMDITLSSEQLKLQGPALLEMILSQWVNSRDSLLEMIVIHLPSPVTAQKYRTSVLYEGPQNDDYALAMRECNPKGPLMIHVSRMIPGFDGKFYAFGRVFSGTISVSQNVRIITPDHQPGDIKKQPIAKIKKIMSIASKSIEEVESTSCGNVIAIGGIGKHILKLATISDPYCIYRIRVPKCFSLAVSRIAIEPRSQADLPQLVDSLKQLSQYDPLVRVMHEETGDHFIAGVDEQHVKMCLEALINKFSTFEINASNPLISYRETVTQLSQVCLTKAPNKANRFYCTAQPLPNGITDLFDKGLIRPDSVKENTKIFCEDFGWTTAEAKGIWTFGPDSIGPNVFVDVTENVDYVSTIKDKVITIFQWVSREGVLCEENMRQVRINLVNASLHPDALRRSSGQIMPTVRRVCYACELAAKPRLQEPMFQQQIITTKDKLIQLYLSITCHRGRVLEEEELKDSSLIKLTVILPAGESSKLESLLIDQSVCSSFSEPIFSNWEFVESDPLEIGSSAHNIVTEIRKRKGLKEEIPLLTDYCDKL